MGGPRLEIDGLVGVAVAAAAVAATKEEPRQLGDVLLEDHHPQFLVCACLRLLERLLEPAPRIISLRKFEGPAVCADRGRPLTHTKQRAPQMAWPWCQSGVILMISSPSCSTAWNRSMPRTAWRGEDVHVALIESEGLGVVTNGIHEPVLRGRPRAR